jgi:nitrite reductase/ring-hydroxylating ferredoxin subunit/uncharacterized membrane protein
MPMLDEISDRVQPKVRAAVEAGGTAARNVLDGTVMETPLHPVLTDIPIGSWTAALMFDGLDMATGARAMRNAADASVAVGIAGGIAAAVTGLSDWRYLQGESRKMGAAHGILNSAGLLLSATSLLLRATGRRNAGRAAFLVGYSISGTAAHLGGELSYNQGVRVNPNAFVEGGPDGFVPVLDEQELTGDATHHVEADGAPVLLSRSSDGELCAISDVCSHEGGTLSEGRREGDTVVCPLHGSRFDLRTGKALEGPAVFPQRAYETRAREGKVEIKAVE